MFYPAHPSVTARAPRSVSLERNLVVIPNSLASQHGIKPGIRLDWKESDRPEVLTVMVLPDYAAIASSLLGAGALT